MNGELFLLNISIITIVIFYLLLNSPSITSVRAEVGWQFYLKNKSFKIKSSISRANIDGERPAKIQLTESYSVEQHRSKIEYTITSGDSNNKQTPTEFYYDLWTGMSLNYIPKSKTCSAGTIKELQENLFFGSNLIELFNEAGGDQDINGIIGPAKLLFVIASNAENMKMIPTDLLVSTMVRNHPVVEYELFLPFHSVNRAVKLTIYFDKSYQPSLAQSHSIPLEVVITFLKPTVSGAIVINYFLQDIKDSQLEANLKDIKNMNKVIDEFTFPLSFNCSSFLDNSIHADLFEQYDVGTTRFSFEVLSDYNMGSSHFYSHFVAFDGITQTMRIDARRTNHVATQRNVRPSKRIIDFRTNRKYVMVEDKQSDNNDLISELRLSKRTKCVVTKALPPDMVKRRQNILKLSELIVGATSFVYMGRARVNGIEARVFEAYTNSMPYWSNDPQLYQNKNSIGDYGIRRKGQRLKDNPNAVNRLLLNVLVYVAEGKIDTETDERDDQQIKILLLELYDLRIVKSSSYRRVMVAKFFNFAFDLAAAPNGDRAFELFSKKDSCGVGSNGDDRYAQVSLFLEKSVNLTEEEVKNDDSDWINDWNRRNEALTASIRDVLDIQNIMMYDLESKLIPKIGGKMGIVADFRVAEHAQLLYSITFVGNAILYPTTTQELGDSGGKVARVLTISLADCLWTVNNHLNTTNHPIYIYYFEDKQECILDLELAKNPKANPNASKVFAMSPNQLGEVFKIELELDTEISLYNTWLRDGRFRDLENRKMILQDIHPQDRRKLPPKELAFRIKRVNLENLSSISRVAVDRDRQIQSPSMMFIGFALPEFSSYSRKLLLTTAASDNAHLQIRDQSSLSSSSSFTLEQCKAACLEDLDCRSFSFCVRMPEVQCILSNVSFEEPGIKEQLSNGYRVGGLKVELVKTNGIEVELIRDPKCELHNKIFMELFERNLMRKSSLVGMEVFSVSGEEQCAGICFEKSLQSIKLSANLNKEIKDIFEKDKDGDSIRELLGKKKKELEKTKSSFCQYFMYSDSTLEPKQMELLDLRAGSPEAEPTAYCILEASPKLNEQNEENKYSSTDDLGNDTVSFDFTSYLFDFEKLYEKRFGFRFVMSEKSQKELDAYYLARTGEQMSSDQYETLRNAMNEGKNFQVIGITKSDIDCAKMCFIQTSELWPSCRSFDILVAHHTHDESLTKFCRLNSASLDQIKPNDVIDESPGILMWHYEPRFGLIKQDIEATYDLEFFDVHRSQSKMFIKFSTVNLILLTSLILLSATSGLFLGAKIAHKINLYLEGHATRDEGNSNSVMMTSTSSIDTNLNYTKFK